VYAGLVKNFPDKGNYQAILKMTPALWAFLIDTLALEEQFIQLKLTTTFVRAASST
jgi:hypothetical protein